MHIKLKHLLIPLILLLPAQVLRAEAAAANAEAKALYFRGEHLDAYNKYAETAKKFKDKNAYLNAGFIALEQGNIKACVKIAELAQKQMPKDPDVTELLAECYLYDGQFKKSEKILSVISVLQDNPALYHSLLARAQLGMNETEMSVYNFKLAAKDRSQLTYANFMLGRIYQQQEEWALAAEHYLKVLKYDHQFFEARKNYAFVLEKLENTDEAWKQYRSVYQTEKSDDIKKILDRLEPLLTKTKAEILQPQIITAPSNPSVVAAADKAKKIIKIGLGAKVNGAPSDTNKITFMLSENYQIKETASGKILHSGKPKDICTASKEKNSYYLQCAGGQKTAFKGGLKTAQKSTKPHAATVIIKELVTGDGMSWARNDDREFRGELEILINNKLKTLVPVSHVDLEEYLLGVMSAEMPPTFPEEAQRAQAVLARTYTLHHMGKHKAYGYDLCDAQNCQVYAGVKAETKQGNHAVKSTSGEILTHNGKPIEAVFAASAGGATQSSKDAGWFAHEYLQPTSDYKGFSLEEIEPHQFKKLFQSVPDAYSNYTKSGNPSGYRWARVVPAEVVEKFAKKKNKNLGELRLVAVEKRNESGYISRIRIKGTKGSVVYDTQNRIKANMATGLLRSTSFIILPVYEKKKLKEFIIWGGAWGHGVGFCQTGAAGRAAEGQDYKQILQHYFPAAKLENTKKNK